MDLHLELQRVHPRRELRSVDTTFLEGLNYRYDKLIATDQCMTSS